ncbi:hypothetical protein D3C72_1848260 [compost metagenome]
MIMLLEIERALRHTTPSALAYSVDCRMPRRISASGTPCCLPSLSALMKLPVTAMPALLSPARASVPASAKVSMAGPSSGWMRSTTPSSRLSTRQSQFCAWMSLPSRAAEGMTTTPVQPSGGSVASSCWKA